MPGPKQAATPQGTLAPPAAADASNPAVSPQPEATKKKKPKNKKPSKTAPSGFEEYVTEGPLTIKEYGEELGLYDISKPLPERIEICVQRYRAKRKWDENRTKIFNGYLTLGGIATGPKMFSGGLDPKKAHDMDAEEIQRVTATDFVTQTGAGEEHGDWEVDFEYVVRAFFSYKIPYVLGFSKEEDFVLATQVVKNFLNYVLFHNVAPEHIQSINAARELCGQAEKELVLCRTVSNLFPGRFHMASSALFEGYYAGIVGSEEIPWTNLRHSQSGFGEDVSAIEVFKSALAQRGTSRDKEEGIGGIVRSKEYMSLEVCGITMPDDAPIPDDQKHFSGMHRLGDLRLKPWVPPKDGVDSALPTPDSESFAIWMEKSILQYCFVGMHIDCRVHRMSSGLIFIDTITAVMCSFYIQMDDPNTIDSDEEMD